MSRSFLQTNKRGSEGKHECGAFGHTSSRDVSVFLTGFACVLETWAFSFCFVLNILIL